MSAPFAFGKAGPRPAEQSDPLNLARIVRELEQYDPVDVLATFGALQLLPENAERILRFESLSLAATLTNPLAKPRPFLATKVRQVCNDAGATNRHEEDPAENLFTDVVAFYGGSYTIFPGIAENPAHNLQVIARALVTPTRPYKDPDFAQTTLGLIMAVLRLSDAIAKRADLARYAMVPESNGKVVVPHERELARLKGAVTWTRVEIEHLLDGMPHWILDALVQVTPPPRDGAYDLDRNPIHAWPIVRRGDTYVVPIPGLLVWATLNRIIGAATKAGEGEILRENVADAAWLFTEETCKMLGFTQLANEMTPALSIDATREGFFRFDVDKVAYVIMVCDHFAEYDDTDPAAFVADETRSKLIDHRIQLALDHAYSHHGQAHSVLVLLVNQGFTRSVAVRVGRVDQEGEPLMLWMPSADLRTIALLETGNALHIWKFARARHEVRREIHVSVVNPLDEYGFFRSQNFTYYVSDKARPDFLSISTGYIRSLRAEALRKADRHAVPAPIRGHIAEVVALQPGIPIYFTTQDLGRPIRRFVEGLVPTWVVPLATTDEETAPILHMLGDAIAYWVWQSQASLARLFPSVAARATTEPLYIRIETTPGMSWTDYEVAHQDTSPPFEIGANAASFEISVTFHPSCAKMLQGGTNDGERALLLALFQAMPTLAPEAAPTKELIQSTVDSIAPTGPKKKMMVLQTGESQLGHPGRLPAPRPLDRAEQQRLLDQLGTHLAKTYAPGVLPPDRAQAIVHDSVEWFFQRLSSLVKQLRPDGLIKAIMLYDEAVLARQILVESTIAAQLACYGDTPLVREELVEETHRIYATAVSHRFLIEYVAAQPPAGLRPLSLSVLDELLALCEKIITYGFDGDLLFFKLAPAEFGMLPSRRLGRSTSFDAARNAYMRVVTARGIQSQSDRFARYWSAPEPGVPDPPPDLARLDEACAFEFGISLTKLRAVFSKLLADTLDAEDGLAEQRPEEMRDSLVSSCGLTSLEADAALELLTLRPRADFFVVTPLKKREVYPWKYNRALSYIRRPLVIATDPDTKEHRVQWGRRHVFRASQYLGGLIFDGRLQPRTKAMAEWLGAQANKRGAEFEKATVAMLMKRGQIVKAGVEKIRTTKGKIKSPGDIDVLVIDEKRKRIYLVECKDIAVSRTPAEIANELDKLTKDEPGRRSITTKHLARVEWVKEHMDEVLLWAGATPGRGWQVVGRVITDEQLFAPSLRRLPLPVLPFDDVERLGLR